MRPDVSELLGGVRRILDETVAPEVGSAYALQVLRGAAATLLALEKGWARVPSFLAWDNAATAALLRRVRDGAPGEVARRIDATLDAGEPDPLDVAASTARNDALRAALAELLADAGGGAGAHSHAATPADIATALAPHREAISLHLEERARRAPIRLVPLTPGRVPRKEP